MAKDRNDNATFDMFEREYPKQKRGRRPIYGQAMTAAERSRKYRADKKRRDIEMATCANPQPPAGLRNSAEA